MALKGAEREDIPPAKDSGTTPRKQNAVVIQWHGFVLWIRCVYHGNATRASRYRSGGEDTRYKIVSVTSLAYLIEFWVLQSVVLCGVQLCEHKLDHLRNSEKQRVGGDRMGCKQFRKGERKTKKKGWESQGIVQHQWVSQSEPLFCLSFSLRNPMLSVHFLINNYSCQSEHSTCH